MVIAVQATHRAGIVANVPEATDAKNPCSPKQNRGQVRESRRRKRGVTVQRPAAQYCRSAAELHLPNERRGFRLVLVCKADTQSQSHHKALRVFALPQSRPSRKRRIVGEVIYIDPSHAETCLSEQGYGFVRELDEALGSVAVVLRTLEQGGSSRICLHTLSTNLLDLLALVEPEPLIEAAVDQLAWAARRLVAARQREGQPEPERHRELGAAYLRLRGRVALARPRYKTRQMG